MKAHVVLGTQFGDEAKGLTTSYICENTTYNVVIRFSGGQQAGHTVIKDGIKHIHSNFGSGTLNGVPTYFTEHCTFYPNTMERERQLLISKSINPVLILNPLTKITTPSDVAYNRIRESKLKHGSCGLGVGATMKRHDTTGYKLFANDIKYPSIFKQKLQSISNYYKSIIDKQDLHEFEEIEASEFEFFNSVDLSHIQIEPYYWLMHFENLIFEGSQGILLDMDHGIFPNVTYANTTSKNAIEICQKLGIDDVEIYYVTRCYQTRHGNGWMSNESELNLINNEEEINKFNKWQTNFRIGEIDYDLLNYALQTDCIYHDMIIPKTNLVLTCLDQRPDFKFKPELINHEFNSILESNSPVSTNIIRKKYENKNLQSVH